MHTRRACDRCHQFKEKCTFENGAAACALCKRSSSVCSTSRVRQRRGRRPQVQSLGPKGSMQIWEVESSSASTTSSPLSIELNSQLAHITQLYSSSTGEASVPSLFNSKFTVSNQLLDWQFDPPFDEWTPAVIKGFSKTYEMFMIGPSFAPSLRAALVHAYMCSPALLRDIFRLIGKTITRTDEDEDGQEVDLAKGTDSVKKLRTAHVTGVQDALAVMALGQTLAAFDLMTNCIGSTLILRYSLSCVEPFYQELSKDHSLDPVTICPVFWDTLCCLIKREVPILKFSAGDGAVADRMAGYCTSLLPIFYDLCIESHEMKNQLHGKAERNLNTLERIQERLRSWTLDHKHSSHSSFSHEELLGMKAQATMYKSAGLLVTHRMIHALGTQDDVAASYAECILAEFSSHSSKFGPDVRLRNVAFPMFLAMLEVSEMHKDVWQRIPLLAVAPKCVARMSEVIDFVWEERNRGDAGLLFDLIDRGPDFVIVP